MKTSFLAKKYCIGICFIILIHFLQTKEYLKDPSKFAAAAAAAAPAPSAGAEAKKEEAKQESEEESDDDMGFGLFD